MNSPKILYKFIENECEIKVPITNKVQKVTSCDIFIYESSFMLVSDLEISLFICPGRRFAIDDIKNIPISFNSEQREYTCVLPCHPQPDVSKEPKTNKTVKVKESLSRFTCITDSCVLSVDGTMSEIQADFPYGFSGRYRGKPKYSEADLSHICRITDPSSLCPIKRTIQRDNQEQKDFCRDQYKINLAELTLNQGHENPLKYTISYDDVQLTEEEESLLQSIKSKHPAFDVQTDQINIDFELVSILLGICYDIRSTSNEPTCESHWTRSILSPVLSYFERFDNLEFVVESFLRRSLIYPLYRHYDLACLCVQDAVQGMQKGKSWILKQLLVTYNCFCEAEFNRKALNKYFIKHYIWYVDAIMDDEYLPMLSKHLKDALLQTTEDDLRLGLTDIAFEMFTELMGDLTFEMSRELRGVFGRRESTSESENESGSSSDSSLDYEVNHEGKIII